MDIEYISKYFIILFFKFLKLILEEERERDRERSKWERTIEHATWIYVQMESNLPHFDVGGDAPTNQATSVRAIFGNFLMFCHLLLFYFFMIESISNEFPLNSDKFFNSHTYGEFWKHLLDSCEIYILW